MSDQLITVFGGARVLTDDQLYADCRNLGHLLAEAGYTVASGGYTGTMEAVLRGAAEAGGHTIGYTCTTFEANFSRNKWVQEERLTSCLSARIQRLADESDAFVTVLGGLGTLAELSLVWNMMLAGEIRRRPFIVVGPAWSQVLDCLYSNTQMGSSALRILTRVDNVNAVVAALRFSVIDN
jgi:uncharacterized protein (TIGR00730 family)